MRNKGNEKRKKFLYLFEFYRFVRNFMGWSVHRKRLSAVAGSPVRRGLLVAAAAIFAVACHDGPFREPAPAEPSAPATTTIAEVRRLLEQGSQNALTVTGDLAVSGIVTTSDRRYNFYHTLCIESDGAGLEVMAGIDRLHVDYPAGCRVTLRLKGLTLGFSRGVLQAGAKPEVGSYYPTGYLASPAAVAAHLVRLDETVAPVEPTRRRIGELTPEQCGTLVRIDTLRYDPADAAETGWAGTRRFRDVAGAAVYTYVRSGADFVDAELPAGRCALAGILQYEASGDRYLLKLRDENDVISD